MASLVGHALGALSAWEVGRQAGWVPRAQSAYLAPVALAVAPDLDVVFGMLFSPPGQIVHRGPTHSLAFALGLAALTSLGWFVVQRLRSREIRLLPLFGTLFACCLMHPLLDYLMGCGPPVPFLWPWVEKGWLSPVQLIPTAYYARSPGGLLSVLVHPRTWIGVGLELFSLGGLWLAARSRMNIRRLIWIGLSAIGFGVTAGIYL